MSGGSMDYAFLRVYEACERIKPTTERRRAVIEHLRLVAEALRAIEWVDSGDSGPEYEEDAITGCIGEDGCRVCFNVVDFIAAHGRLPRGEAIWIFNFPDTPDDPWLARIGEQLQPMEYSAAKLLATAEARRRSVGAVTVDPHPL
jgi:hypothetical protein